MASVSTQCLCMVCGISVESVDIRAHCGSQPHIDKCNRKYRDPRDRALRGGGGSGAHNKPYHNPETPSSSTTAMGMRKISQPQSSSASSNTPALDLNSTAPQDLRTRASTSPPLPIFPPAVPQGCFCTPCNTRVQFSAIREHLKSTEHTARCLSDAYHFTASNHLSLHPPDSSEQISHGYLPNTSSSMTAAWDPNPTFPQYIRTDTSTSWTLRTIPRAVPQGCFCAVCNTQIQFSAIMEHLKPPEHTAKCKSIGLYCISCQKPFLNDLALSVHKDMAHKLNTRRTDSPANTASNHELLQAQAEARREIGLYCADCNMTFRTKHKLQIHIRTTRHQPGTPIPAGEPTPPAVHCNICSTEHVPGETTDSHERSERHLNACKAHDLYCHECKSIFDSTAALNFHVCQPIPPKPSAPAQYPCPNCSQTFQKRKQWTKHKRHCLYWIPCIACNVEINWEDVTNHKLSQEHIDNSKLKGVYCHLCELSFMGVQGLQTHQVNSITHKQNLRKSGQSSEQGIEGEVSGGTKYCGICNANYVSSTKDHLRTQAHIDVCKEKDLYCTGCKLIFPTDRLRQIHVCSNRDPSRPNTFHCCDCDKSFPTNSQFIKHLKKGCHLKEGAFKCDPCNLAFSTRKQLNLHLNSNTHRTLKCLGSTKCQRKFKNLAAMIQHLESGGCVSKLNRATIDGLVRSHDTAGAITIKDCPTPAMALTGLHEYHFNGSSPPALNAPVDQSEGSDDGSIILTPATVLTPVSAQSRRNSTASTSAVLTSTISEFEFQLAKPQCNICGRTFASVTRLQMHIASPVHAVPIYHCPIDFLGELGLGGKEKNKKEKVFRTLSGLAQHIETGACRGGKQTWQKAIEFLEGKLAGFGLAGVKLLGQ